MDNQPLPIRAIAERLSTPWGIETLSPMGDSPLLLVDLSDPGPVCDTDLDRCRHWLPRLPCPVIGVGNNPQKTAPRKDSNPDWTETLWLDTRVASLREAQSLVTNIRRHPIAAMTLIQLLRHSEDITVELGLLAESLAYATLQGGREFQRWRADYASTAYSPDNAPSVIGRRSGSNLEIQLNRPGQRNAFSTRMRDQLTEQLHLLTMDQSITMARIRGSGSCFCIGGDLTEFGSYPDTATAHAVRSTRHPGLLIHQLRARVECQVHSACIGAGIELPAFAACIVARRDSFFQLPELQLGLIPGAGGTVSIPRRIGRQRTAWMALSGKRINATKALDWGLIDAIA